MPKRILLAEESETIRKIAESLLRQNGFEVLSMTSGEKALEVLKFTSPDLILVASDMMYKGDTTLFEKLQSDSKTSQFSMLLLANEDENDLPLPPEAIIQKPIDPKEFNEKVSLFSGQSSPDSSIPTPENPLASSEVEDAFLDAALGLDQIDVTDSEVMNQTSSRKINKAQAEEKMIGFENKPDTTDMPSKTGKVESLMITDDATDIKHQNQKQSTPSKEFGSTGGLDILDDQFGIVSQETESLKNENADHDYNWFLDELANENNDNAKAQSQQTKNSADSQSLTFEDNSTFVDPITPSKPQKSSQQPTTVDKFIDEFKKEVEKFGSDVPESITLNETPQKLSESGSVLQWTDSIEKITPQHLELFKRDFVIELADKLAVQIANKIDSDKLLHLLKQEIINKAKKI